MRSARRSGFVCNRLQDGGESPVPPLPLRLGWRLSAQPVVVSIAMLSESDVAHGSRYQAGF